MARVYDLRVRSRLEEYAARFEAAGFDDLDFILELESREDDMARLGEEVGFKTGHKARFEFTLRAEAARQAADAAPC